MIRDAMHRAGYTVTDLWWCSFRLGHAIDEIEIDAYLYNALVLQPRHRNLVVTAANQLMGQKVAPYTWELRLDD